ncbi:prolipoprotein diacylglyceryl transferase [Roseiconus lacunae]|uniref:hypothetical protein n=1 Tax=Roseiconus lacunae TaxID=2605694 RepID=UPI001E5F7A1F|nr:hypothetical protein [Roseiconus lacunae]MCD0461223.1 hypothetical protein [Roseiconus lacunae]
MNPLELFRRNQKVMMTGLILLAMFAFVVLPAVSQYMRSSGPGMADPVLAEFEGVSLNASRVSAFTRNHYSTVQYLRKLAQLTISRGGTPEIFTVDPQTQQIQSVGIQQTPSDELSIRTLQFATLAQQKGLELDDTSIRSWLDRFTNGLITERQRYALLRSETNNQMGEYQLLDMLRKQLLAQLYFQAANASVSIGGMPLLSPLDHWTNFLKLNQQATINAYGVLVNDFVPKTNANPSESSVVALYEAGKDRFPNNQSPEPGFRRRESASFEYLLADLQSFRDAAAEKLTEEEIRAEYDRRKAGGAFVLPDDVITEPSVTEPATTEPSERQPTGDQPESDTPAAEPEMKSGDASEKMSDETPAPEEKPAGAEKTAEMEGDDTANEKAAEEKAAEEAAQKRAMQVESFANEIEAASKLDEQPANETAEGEGKAEADSEETSAEETEDNASEKPATGEESAEEEAPSDEQPAEGEAVDEEDQASRVGERAVQLVAMQADASTEGEQAPAEADQATAAEPETTDEPAAEEADAPATEESRYQPFEDVRDQIVESMVEEPARQARDEALAKARVVMKKYFSQRALTDGDESAEPPPRPNLEALAKDLGLTHRQIGPHTIVSLENEPINDSVDESTALTRQAIPFAVMMFGLGEQVIKQPKFRPIDTVDLGAERHYLTWKTDETEAYTPELDDIRDEVVQAIRIKEARVLAEQEAKAIAKQISEGAKLEDLVPEDRQDNFYQEVGPFSWYNMVGFGQFSIGNVPELDSVGPDFMKAVFTAEDDEAVVSANQPERVYYVVQRQSLLPTSKDLQAIFKQPGQRTMAMFMPSEEATEIQQGFYDTIDEETGFIRYQPEGF